MENGNEKKGVGLKVFGAVLVILGSLNLMLCWRGSMPVNTFYPVIVVIGIAFFVFGTLRGSENK